MDRKDLKELLLKIRNDDYKTPEYVKPFDLTLTMMSYIGDTDGELRDNLILSTIYNWVMDRVLTIEEIRHILKISIDERHLFYGIGQVDDSVFTRTFSVLVADICLSMHLEDKYLTKEELDTVFEKAISYFNEERDLRGYIDEKGWAHGAAHGADTLKSLAECDNFGYEELVKILKAIYNKVNINNYCYIHNEDERMVSAVVAVLDRKILRENEIIDWIKNFKSLDKIGKHPEDMTIEINVKNFLQSLYFRLLDISEYENVVNVTKEVIKEVCSFC